MFIRTDNIFMYYNLVGLGMSTTGQPIYKYYYYWISRTSIYKIMDV